MTTCVLGAGARRPSAKVSSLPPAMAQPSYSPRWCFVGLPECCPDFVLRWVSLCSEFT